MNFGSNISFLRKRKHISQADLAQELEIKRSSLSGYELGNSEPNFENLLKFSDFFKISIDKLLRVDLQTISCLLYTSPSPRDKRQSRMPSSA